MPAAPAILTTPLVTVRYVCSWMAAASMRDIGKRTRGANRDLQQQYVCFCDRTEFRPPHCAVEKKARATDGMACASALNSSYN
jgi:hypothetical protein